MARVLKVGDLVRVANPDVPDAEPDRDFIARIARDRGTDDYMYNFVLDPEPQTHNGFSAAELKKLGRKARAAYEAGFRDGKAR